MVLFYQDGKLFEKWQSGSFLSRWKFMGALAGLAVALLPFGTPTFL